MSSLTLNAQQSEQEKQALIEEVKSEALANRFHSVYRNDIDDVLSNTELARLVLTKAPQLLYNFPKIIKENEVLLLEIAKTISFSYNDQNGNAFVSALPNSVKNSKNFVLSLLEANGTSYNPIFRPYFEKMKSESAIQGVDVVRDTALAYVKHVRCEKMKKGISVDFSTFAKEFPLTLRSDKQFILDSLKQLPEIYKMIPSSVGFKKNSLFNDLDIIKEILSVEIQTPLTFADMSKKASYVLENMWKDNLNSEDKILFLLETCPTNFAYCKWFDPKKDMGVVNCASKGQAEDFYLKSLNAIDNMESMKQDSHTFPAELAHVILNNCPVSVLKNNKFKSNTLNNEVVDFVSKKEIDAISIVKPKTKSTSKRRITRGS